MTLTGNELFDTLRGAIEKLHQLPGLTSTGKELLRNATLKIYDRPTLRVVVQLISEMDLAPHEGHDLKGDMYEYLLSKLSQSGTNGQFHTPRHIIDLLVKLVDPQPGRRVCDPACGTAGFLISTYMHILRSHTKPADLARGIVDGSLLDKKRVAPLARDPPGEQTTATAAPVFGLRASSQTKSTYEMNISAQGGHTFGAKRPRLQRRKTAGTLLVSPGFLTEGPTS